MSYFNELIWHTYLEKERIKTLADLKKVCDVFLDSGFVFVYHKENGRELIFKPINFVAESFPAGMDWISFSSPSGGDTPKIEWAISGKLGCAYILKNNTDSKESLQFKLFCHLYKDQAMNRRTGNLYQNIFMQQLIELGSIRSTSSVSSMSLPPLNFCYSGQEKAFFDNYASQIDSIFEAFYEHKSDEDKDNIPVIKDNIPVILVKARYNKSTGSLISLTPFKIESLDSFSLGKLGVYENNENEDNALDIEEVIEPRQLIACFHPVYCISREWKELQQIILNACSKNKPLIAFVQYLDQLNNFLINFSQAIDFQHQKLDKARRQELIEQFITTLQNTKKNFICPAGNLLIVEEEQVTGNETTSDLSSWLKAHKIVALDCQKKDKHLGLSLPGGLQPIPDSEGITSKEILEKIIIYNAKNKLLPFLSCSVGAYGHESSRRLSQKNYLHNRLYFGVLFDQYGSPERLLNQENNVTKISEIIDRTFLEKLVPTKAFLKQCQDAELIVNPAVFSFWEKFPASDRYDAVSTKITQTTTILPVEIKQDSRVSYKNISDILDFNGEVVFGEVLYTLKRLSVMDFLNPSAMRYPHESYAIWVQVILWLFEENPEDNNTWNIVSNLFIYVTQQQIETLDQALKNSQKEATEIFDHCLLYCKTDDEMFMALKEKYAINWMEFLSQQQAGTCAHYIYKISEEFSQATQNNMDSLWKTWFETCFKPYYFQRESMLGILGYMLQSSQQINGNIDYNQRRQWILDATNSGVLKKTAGCHILFISEHVEEEKWSFFFKQFIRALGNFAREKNNVPLVSALQKLRSFTVLRTQRYWGGTEDKKAFYGGTTLENGSLESDPKQIAWYNAMNKLALSDVNSNAHSSVNDALLVSNIFPNEPPLDRLTLLSTCLDATYLIHLEFPLELLNKLKQLKFIDENTYNFYVKRTPLAKLTSFPKLVESYSYTFRLDSKESDSLLHDERDKQKPKKNENTFDVAYKQCQQHLLEINIKDTKYLHEEYFGRLKFIYDTLDNAEEFVEIICALNQRIVDNMQQKDLKEYANFPTDRVFKKIKMDHAISFQNYMILNPTINEKTIQADYPQLSKKYMLNMEDRLQSMWNEKKDWILSSLATEDASKKRDRSESCTEEDDRAKEYFAATESTKRQRVSFSCGLFDGNSTDFRFKIPVGGFNNTEDSPPFFYITCSDSESEEILGTLINDNKIYYTPYGNYGKGIALYYSLDEGDLQVLGRQYDEIDDIGNGFFNQLKMILYLYNTKPDFVLKLPGFSSNESKSESRSDFLSCSK